VASSAIASNLTDSFRRLAAARPRADMVELPGLSIASLGVRFQMFNAAFLNAPVETQPDLVSILDCAAAHFRSRGIGWSLWICEDWLSKPVRRVLTRTCESKGLRLTADMPGMAARALAPPRRDPPAIEIVPVDSLRALEDFQAIGATCFRVPLEWFREVFDADMWTQRAAFRCWTAYQYGVPVATAATVRTGATLGLYNIATTPGHRRQGIAEALTRHAAATGADASEIVLQSTAEGYRLYERLGFRTSTRVLVYNSV
jgi:GNAT superfamily N-acetyltransferase